MTEENRIGLRRSVYEAILLFGIVSLMGDVIYEGSRGIVPDYLKFLGASAVVVGLVSGFGEFLGYAVRILSGYLADLTKSYWLFTLIGYGLIVAVPLLSLSNMWTVAIILIILERIGKAIRTPARDTLLSIIGRGSETGKVFGLHEFFDQIGAIIGPMLMSIAMLYTCNNYQLSFSLMFIPYIILILALSYAFIRIGRTISIEKTPRGGIKGKLDTRFKKYVAAVFFNTFGLIPASLILYKASTLLSTTGQQWIVPILYLVIQAVDAPIAIVSGYFYDKHGLKILSLPFLLSIAPSLIASLQPSLLSLTIASICFGMVLGMQESIYRAAVSDLVEVNIRGSAYGVFNTAYGLGMLLGGLAYGFFTDTGFAITAVAFYSISLQLVALLLLRKTFSKAGPQKVL
ncbi:MAG: MFS transporter [Candidatus Brockarchaeota archaeon]|nr:MFS transporter [Candidatus Brockarchaeota archaeon]